jgi:hypothetical protein
MSLKKLRKLKKKNTEIGQMIQAVGNDLIMLGETAEKRQNYLQTVCIAWNISCLPEKAREQKVKDFIRDFQTTNQCSDENTCNFEHSVRLVIEAKLSLYPNSFIEILDSSLEAIGERDRIKILSRPMK